MKKKFLELFDIKMWKFLLVGILNTLVGNGLTFLLLDVAHLGYWPSSAISYTLASVMSYFLNRYFTFQYKEKGWKPVARFAINIAVCYLLSYGLAKPLIRLILSGSSEAVRDNVATIVAMCLFVGFNYLGQRFFAFREPKKEAADSADSDESSDSKKSSDN